MSTELDRCTLIFQEFGLTRVEGTILSVLLAGIPVKAEDIEKAAGLRQPEVSKGTEKLLQRGWIGKKNQNGVGAGRPHKIYFLISTKKKIFNDIYIEYKNKNDIKELCLFELKELLEVK